MDEKKVTTGTQLSDEALAGVAGGLTRIKQHGKYYKYVGGDKYSGDWDRIFLCPFCGGPLHYGPDRTYGSNRWSCDECRATWAEEYTFDINPTSGLWKEVTAAEYWDPSLG